MANWKKDKEDERHENGDKVGARIIIGSAKGYSRNGFKDSSNQDKDCDGEMLREEEQQVTGLVTNHGQKHKAHGSKWWHWVDNCTHGGNQNKTK